MTEDTPHVPVACNPHALPPEEWAAHQATAQRLFAVDCIGREELPDGYAFRFPAAALPLVAAFVAGERRCCPFLTFVVEVPPGEAPIRLRLTGSPEAKAVIAAELLDAR
jgi:hypothetical protein